MDVADKYYVIAGIAFLIFYVFLRKRVSWKKIQAKFPQGKDYRREVIFSTISIVIFSLPPLFNVYGHLGFELYPVAFHRHWLGRWMKDPSTLKVRGYVGISLFGRTVVWTKVEVL